MQKRIIDLTEDELRDIIRTEVNGNVVQLTESPENASLQNMKLAPDQAIEYLEAMRNRASYTIQALSTWVQEGLIINYGDNGMRARYDRQELLDAYDCKYNKNAKELLQIQITEKRKSQLTA